MTPAATPRAAPATLCRRAVRVPRNRPTRPGPQRPPPQRPPLRPAVASRLPGWGICGPAAASARGPRRGLRGLEAGAGAASRRGAPTAPAVRGAGRLARFPWTLPRGSAAPSAARRPGSRQRRVRGAAAGANVPAGRRGLVLSGTPSPAGLRRRRPPRFPRRLRGALAGVAPASGDVPAAPRAAVSSGFEAPASAGDAAGFWPPLASSGPLMMTHSFRPRGRSPEGKPCPGDAQAFEAAHHRLDPRPRAMRSTNSWGRAAPSSP